MKRLLMGVTAVVSTVAITGCGTSGLSEEAKKNTPTVIWFDNANLLVDAYDPDLKADTFIGIPQLDAVVDTVKDILVQVPAWTVTKVEQKHFRNTYMESAKALNGGADGADLVVKGEAFKTVLLMDTYAREVAHARAAVGLPRVAKQANYAQNEQVYKDAVAKVVDYANNQVFPFESCVDDAARRKFFSSPARAHWGARAEEIAAKIKACVAMADNEAAAKAGIARLRREMGVQEVDWGAVAAILSADLLKLTNAARNFILIMQSDRNLQTKLAVAVLGGSVVPGVSGRETLAVIARVSKQLTVNARLCEWLIKSIGE